MAYNLITVSTGVLTGLLLPSGAPQARRLSSRALQTIRWGAARRSLPARMPIRSPIAYTKFICLQGFGWAIAKALAEAGCEISLGVWVSVPARGFLARSAARAMRNGPSFNATAPCCCCDNPLLPCSALLPPLITHPAHPPAC